MLNVFIENDDFCIFCKVCKTVITSRSSNMILCVQAESSIAKLRKKEGELEAAAQKGEGGKTEEEDTKEPKHQSLAQIIYADNRVSVLSFAQECGLVFDGCDLGIES